MTQWTKRWLSLLGILLSIAGFYVDKAPSFPSVQRLIAPSYVSARQGIASLQKRSSLQIGEPGFAALANYVENRIAAQNGRVPRARIKLERLEAAGGGIEFGDATSKQTVRLNMFLRGQAKPLEWDLLELSDTVETAWKERSLTWASWLFWVGILQAAWPLFARTKPKASAVS